MASQQTQAQIPATENATATRHYTSPVTPARTYHSPATELYAGDVVYFPRKDIHALLRSHESSTTTINPDHQPPTVDLIWLDGYSLLSPTRNIDRDTLESMGREGRLKIVRRGITTTDQINRAPAVRNPERYHRDDTITIGARLPTSKLTFDRIYSLKQANGFLKHPVVDHKQGRVQKAKGIFVARRPDDKIAAVVTINSVNAREAFDRQTVEITRYASHPETDSTHRTNNTATWMLSRVCQWAALEGYTTIRTYAGTDGNDGTIYKAANFKSAGTANSTGKYNREGRTNPSHDRPLTRYKRSLSISGQYAKQKLPPRAETRLEQQGSTSEPTLNAFTSPSETIQRTPPYFQFTREDITDTKFSTTHPDAYPAFSYELQELMAKTNPPFDLDSLTSARRNNYPAAAFGAAVDGTLVATTFVTGNPTTDKHATIAGYTARPTKYPEQTAQWLLTKARDWAMLTGFDGITISPESFTHIDSLSPKLPKSIGFSKLAASTWSYVYHAH